MKSPIRWAGSKRNILPQIMSHLPKTIKSYCEPFCGSACLFFEINCKNSTISDMNSLLIEFYQQVGEDPENVWSRFCSYEREKDVYYEIRKSIYQQKCKSERAAQFYFLNRNCFNGIFRTNKLGHFNVPFSDSRVPKYPTREEFFTASKILRDTKIINGDFESVCRDGLESGIFYYLDPPYFETGKRIFREYDADCFSPSDFPRLIQLIDDIDAAGAKFLISFPDSPSSRETFSKWNLSSISTRRIVAANSDARPRISELMVRNY